MGDFLLQLKWKRSALHLLQDNSHYRQTVKRWQDFAKFAYTTTQQRPVKWTGSTVISYFTYIGERSKQPKTHTTRCLVDDTCQCPCLHRPSTLHNIRTAISNGFRLHAIFPNPANDFIVDCFLKTVRKHSDISRIEERQALPISRQKANDVAAQLEMTAYTKPETIFALTCLRNSALIRLLSYTGGRAVDILNLQWTDIQHYADADKIVINIKVGKTATTQKPWKIVIDTKSEGRLAQILVTFGRECSKLTKINGYIFRTFTGGKLNQPSPLSRTQLAALIKEKFGQKFTTHSFRVAKAIGLKQLGLTWSGIAAGIGATPTTAERYARRTETYEEIMY